MCKKRNIRFLPASMKWTYFLNKNIARIMNLKLCFNWLIGFKWNVCLRVFPVLWHFEKIYTTTIGTITWKCIHVFMYIRILILTFTNMRFIYWHLKNYNDDFIKMHVERSLHFDNVWIVLIWYITMRFFGAHDRQIKYLVSCTLCRANMTSLKQRRDC